MSSSDDRSMVARPGGGAWGKDPLRNDVAERIKQQTNENIQKRLREQKEEVERNLAEMAEGRKQDRLKYEKEIEDALALVDTLLDFIAQRAGEIPEELLDIIVRRQEQRILESAPADITKPSTAALPPTAARDGDILRRGPDGIVDWVPASVLQEIAAELGKRK